MTQTRNVRSRMTPQERKLRDRLVKRAVKLDRLEEAYLEAGDLDNARSVGLEADALWAQAQDLTERVKEREGI